MAQRTVFDGRNFRVGVSASWETRGLTWMADDGVPVRHLRKIAGHGSLTTTQRYLHPNRDAVTNAGDLLSNYLAGPPSGPRLRAV